MRIHRLLLFIFILVVVICCQASSESDSSIEDADEDEDYDIVGINPNYEEPPDETDEYDTDVEDEDTDIDEDDTKGILAKALAKTRKSPQFFKRNRAKITIAVALFAFRREIGHFLLRLITVKSIYVNKETGEMVVHRRLNLSPTSVLKIIIFLDLMRRIQKGDSDSDVSLVAMGPQGAFLAPLLSMIKDPGNTAFVPPVEQHWTFERLNERYERDVLAFEKALVPPSSRRSMGFQRAKNGPTAASRKVVGNTTLSSNDTVIVMDLTGLTQSVSQIPMLRDQVSFLLTHLRAQRTKAIESIDKNGTLTKDIQATKTTDEPLPKVELEIVVLLESPGGSAADYGLAAEQILRLRREPGIDVTICVDRVAASGGYMIACCSSPGRLYAAPFALLGSIGVIGTAINIDSLLQGYGVTPLVFRGGKAKAPVGLIGEVTKEGIAKVQSMVDATHAAFKHHVATARPVLLESIDAIATGDVWLATDGLKVGLVDRIISSDEYVGERLREGASVLRLIKYDKRRGIHFPPLGAGQMLPRSFHKSLKATFVDLPAVISKLSELLGVSSSSIADAPTLSSDVVKSFSAAQVQATSSPSL